MIVPMKKVSLFIRESKKEETLKKLRKAGILHIEITEGSGERLASLREQSAVLERALLTIGKPKAAEQKDISTADALAAAERILSLDADKKQHEAERIALSAELDRLAGWGDIDPSSIRELEARGYEISFYEMPRAEYGLLTEKIRTVRLDATRSTVRFMLLRSRKEVTDAASPPTAYRLVLPQLSTQKMRQRLSELSASIAEIDEALASAACYTEGIKGAIQATEKEIEFETYATGMAQEALQPDGRVPTSISYFTGYIEAENLDGLKQTAASNSWGLLVEEPTEEDNVPTKLKNNRFVSLIYPLTDFLGTVPGYFEYDISGWFLAFILIFFGIIFGDGGYGLLICAIAAIPIARALITGKQISPMFLLVGLFGLSTVLWGTVTCTWFGLPPEKLPAWLKVLSVPPISNVYAERLWTLPWTPDGVGLTTAQNLQIFCFSLALIQLSVAHIKGAARHRASIKMLGDIGSILQLLGIYYLVLSLVVNAEVFSFGLVIGGIPVGIVAIALIATGFAMSFVFSNYEGSLIRSILSSLKNIVSVLLGVVNVFSDIVSYIRLWAVGIAGAAISATVNELVSPLLGNFMLMIFAIVLLVFGHGLNMILNILSVIVHGIRLNTLEFSSHLDMSWSGHKFKPFKEQID